MLTGFLQICFIIAFATEQTRLRSVKPLQSIRAIPASNQNPYSGYALPPGIYTAPTYNYGPSNAYPYTPRARPNNGVNSLSPIPLEAFPTENNSPPPIPFIPPPIDIIHPSEPTLPSTLETTQIDPTPYHSNTTFLPKPNQNQDQNSDTVYSPNYPINQQQFVSTQNPRQKTNVGFSPNYPINQPPFASTQNPSPDVGFSPQPPFASTQSARKNIGFPPNQIPPTPTQTGNSNMGYPNNQGYPNNHAFPPSSQNQVGAVGQQTTSAPAPKKMEHDAHPGLYLVMLLILPCTIAGCCIGRMFFTPKQGLFYPEPLMYAEEPDHLSFPAGASYSQNPTRSSSLRADIASQSHDSRRVSKGSHRSIDPHYHASHLKAGDPYYETPGNFDTPYEPIYDYGGTPPGKKGKMIS